jgi:hypothetical protein
MLSATQVDSHVAGAPLDGSAQLVEVVMLQHLNVLVRPSLVVEYGVGEIVELSAVGAADWCERGWARLAQ